MQRNRGSLSRLDCRTKVRCPRLRCRAPKESRTIPFNRFWNTPPGTAKRENHQGDYRASQELKWKTIVRDPFKSAEERLSNGAPGRTHLPWGSWCGPGEYNRCPHEPEHEHCAGEPRNESLCKSRHGVNNVARLETPCNQLPLICAGRIRSTDILR